MEFRTGATTWTIFYKGEDQYLVNAHIACANNSIKLGTHFDIPDANKYIVWTSVHTWWRTDTNEFTVMVEGIVHEK